MQALAAQCDSPSCFDRRSPASRKSARSSYSTLGASTDGSQSLLDPYFFATTQTFDLSLRVDTGKEVGTGYAFGTTPPLTPSTPTSRRLSSTHNVTPTSAKPSSNSSTSQGRFMEKLLRTRKSVRDLLVSTPTRPWTGGPSPASPPLSVASPPTGPRTSLSVPSEYNTASSSPRFWTYEGEKIYMDHQCRLLADDPDAYGDYSDEDDECSPRKRMCSSPLSLAKCKSRASYASTMLDWSDFSTLSRTRSDNVLSASSKAKDDGAMLNMKEALDVDKALLTSEPSPAASTFSLHEDWSQVDHPTLTFYTAPELQTGTPSSFVQDLSYDESGTPETPVVGRSSRDFTPPQNVRRFRFLPLPSIPFRRPASAQPPSDTASSPSAPVIRKKPSLVQLLRSAAGSSSSARPRTPLPTTAPSQTTKDVNALGLVFEDTRI